MTVIVECDIIRIYQLDQRAILDLLRSNAWLSDYTAEQLTLDLTQLTGWGNLVPIQDPHKTYTIEEFKNKQFQYMMSQAALEVEQKLETTKKPKPKTRGTAKPAAGGSQIFRELKG